MNKVETNIITALMQISRAIHSTPVPDINKRTTRVKMAGYHKKLLTTIKIGKYKPFPAVRPPETNPQKKKRSKHRPYINQLTELLVTSISIAAIEFRTNLIISPGIPMIYIEGNYEPISKEIFNGFIKECLIGITGDTDVLADFRKIKREIFKTSFSNKNFNPKN